MDNARLPGTIVNDGARTIPIVAPRTVLRSRTRLAGKVWQWQCCRTQSLADAVLVPITRSSVNHLCSYRFYPGYWIFRRVSDPPKYLLTKYQGVQWTMALLVVMCLSGSVEYILVRDRPGETRIVEYQTASWSVARLQETFE